jgi:hypothetical protein
MYCDNTTQQKKVGCKCMGSDKECQLLRCDRQTKQLEMPVTMLPNIKNKHLLFVTISSCARNSVTQGSFELNGLVTARGCVSKSNAKIKTIDF